MVITWFGLSAFKIASGNLIVVTDPFSKETGLTPPRVQTDIAVISNHQNPAYNNVESLGGDSIFVIDGPGEFDVKGLFVHGIPANQATIYAIRIEEIRLAFLGSLQEKELKDSELEALGEIDILFVPVGGKTVCGAEEAVTITNQIEPHIVIPMHYSQKGLLVPLEPLDKFLKEIGARSGSQEKLTIKRSELASHESEVVVLQPQR